MSTQQTTTGTTSQQGQQSQSNTYNPSSLATYNTLQPEIGSLLSQYMTNPWQSGLFQTQQSQIGSQIAAQNAGQMNNVLNNMTAMGNVYANPGAVSGQLIQQAGLSNQSDLASALLSNLQQAAQLQQSAMSSAMGYSPLQTGATGTSSATGQSNSTSTLSGLGTILTPILGALAGGLSSGLSGGLSSLLSGLGSGSSLDSLPTNTAGTSNLLSGIQSIIPMTMPSVGSATSMVPGQGTVVP